MFLRNINTFHKSLMSKHDFHKIKILLTQINSVVSNIYLLISEGTSKIVKLVQKELEKSKYL